MHTYILYIHDICQFTLYIVLYYILYKYIYIYIYICMHVNIDIYSYLYEQPIMYNVIHFQSDHI